MGCGSSFLRRRIAREAIIPDGRGGVKLDPNWSPPVPEPTVEERLTARLGVLEARLKVLEAG